MEALTRDRVLRGALWTTVALNAVGFAAFAFPALGFESPLLPITAPRFLAAQIAFTIALFGVVYAWLAVQSRINRALIVVGGLGKLGFFGLTLTYALAGDIPTSMAVSALPDLALGVLFLWWARAGGSAPKAGPRR
jgi:hypothetical protein